MLRLAVEYQPGVIDPGIEPVFVSHFHELIPAVRFCSRVHGVLIDEETGRQLLACPEDFPYEIQEPTHHE